MENTHVQSEKSQESGQEKITRLENYVNQGYVLHGAKTRIDILDAHQMHTEETQHAGIYAPQIKATTDVRIAVLKALFGKKDPSENMKTQYEGNEYQLEVTGKNFTLTSGYVYVLPREPFIKEGEEANNKLSTDEQIRPIEIIEVDSSMSSELKGVSIKE